MIINNNIDSMHFNMYCKSCIYRYDDFYRSGCHKNNKDICDENTCILLKNCNDIEEFIDKINSNSKEDI